MEKILDKAKDMINTDIKAIKENKKIDSDKLELNKKLEKRQKEKEEEINKIKEAKQQQSATNSEFPARIRLIVGSGENIEEIADLGAFYGHKEGKQTLKVINKDNEVVFEEVKPDWQTSYQYLDKETIEERIKELEKIIKQFKSGKLQEKKDDKTQMVYYEEDYIAQLRIAKQDLLKCLLGSNGRYSISKAGSQVYTFELVGYFKIPYLWFSDKSVLHIVPEDKIILGQVIREYLNKDFRADETKAERVVLTILAGLTGIALIAAVYIIYKSATMVGVQAVAIDSATQSLSQLLNYSDPLYQINEKLDLTNKILEGFEDIPEQNLTKVIR